MNGSEQRRAPICFRQCDCAHDLQAAFSVRAIVFMDEQRCPFEEEFDHFDRVDSSAIDAPIHIAGFCDKEAVAAGRIRLFPDFAKLERLSVRRAWRGQGAGHELLTYMMQVADERGFLNLQLHAQIQLVDFYSAYGFVAHGPVFTEAGIEHRHMTRTTTSKDASPGVAR